MSGVFAGNQMIISFLKYPAPSSILLPTTSLLSSGKFQSFFKSSSSSSVSSYRIFITVPSALFIMGATLLCSSTPSATVQWTSISQFVSYSFVFIFWFTAILWTGKCPVVFTSWSAHTYQIRSCIGGLVLIWNSKFDLLSLFSNGAPGLGSHHLFTWLNPIVYTNPSESLYLSLS